MQFPMLRRWNKLIIYIPKWRLQPSKNKKQWGPPLTAHQISKYLTDQQHGIPSRQRLTRFTLLWFTWTVTMLHPQPPIWQAPRNNCLKIQTSFKFHVEWCWMMFDAYVIKYYFAFTTTAFFVRKARKKKVPKARLLTFNLAWNLPRAQFSENVSTWWRIVLRFTSSWKWSSRHGKYSFLAAKSFHPMGLVPVPMPRNDQILDIWAHLRWQLQPHNSVWLMDSYTEGCWHLAFRQVSHHQFSQDQSVTTLTSWSKTGCQHSKHQNDLTNAYNIFI